MDTKVDMKTNIPIWIDSHLKGPIIYNFIFSVGLLFLKISTSKKVSMALFLEFRTLNQLFLARF